jgi:nitrite reductase/ring-hydroxylating ferredoxin subunit
LDQGSYEVVGGKLRIQLAKAETLKRAPCAACFISEDEATQLIIVRCARSKYYALSRLCTHARQVVSFVPERRLLMCNGFNHSQFYLDGTIAKGPAEAALQTYSCIAEGGVLEITL